MIDPSATCEKCGFSFRRSPDEVVVNPHLCDVCSRQVAEIVERSWGGYRKGAGRPEYGELLVRRTVTLTSAQISSLEEIGHGNLSAGIRLLVGQRQTPCT